MIVKLQRPMLDDGPYLVHDQGCGRIATVSLPEGWVRRVMGERYTVYVEATWPRGQPVQLHDVVEDQDW